MKQNKLKKGSWLALALVLVLALAACGNKENNNAASSAPRFGIPVGERSGIVRTFAERGPGSFERQENRARYAF